MNSIDLKSRMDTIFTNSQKSKTYNSYRLLITDY